MRFLTGIEFFLCSLSKPRSFLKHLSSEYFGFFINCLSGRIWSVISGRFRVGFSLRRIALLRVLELLQSHFIFVVELRENRMTVLALAVRI